MAEIKSDTNVLTANTETNLLTCPSLQANFSYKLFSDSDFTTCKIFSGGDVQIM